MFGPSLAATRPAETAGQKVRKMGMTEVEIRLKGSGSGRESAVNGLVSTIATELSPLAKTALEVTANARKIQNSQPYLQGLVELQDAASQAVVQALPLADGMRVLDLCAGGGGKTLAMAALARLKLFAHDASPARMRDLPDRARRAGAK